MIEFSCPACSSTFKVPETAAGRRGKCAKCGRVVTIRMPFAIIDDPVFPPENARPTTSIDRVIGIVLFTIGALSTAMPWWGVGIFTVTGISTAAGIMAAVSYVVAVVMLATGRTGYWSAMAGGPGMLAVVAWVWMVRQQESESARQAAERTSEGIALAQMMIGGSPTVLPGAFAAGFLGLAACFIVLGCSLWRSWKAKRIC